MTAALELAVARRIGEFDLDVAFTVESGMSVLFGPSGAGKSLTLALIAGLIRPDTGTITINGHVVTDCAHRTYVSTQKRRIGMVFQDGLLLPHRSVLDNVALAVRQTTGRRARRAVARSWLERVGAEGFATRRPGSLSGGQRQRVALARGLAGEPALVLLDEPLSALEAAVRLELREPDPRGDHLVRRTGRTRDPRCRGSGQLGDVIIAYRQRAGDGDARRRATPMPASLRRGGRRAPDQRDRPGPALMAERARHTALGLEPAVGFPAGGVRGDDRRRRRRVRARVPTGERPLSRARRDRDRVQPAHGAPADGRGLVPPHRNGRSRPIRTAEVRLFGHPLTFTFTGIVIAQIVESFPYCLRFSRSAISGVDPRFEQAARAMGLPRWRVALVVTLPLARRGRCRRCRDGIRPGPG